MKNLAYPPNRNFGKMQLPQRKAQAGNGSVGSWHPAFRLSSRVNSHYFKYNCYTSFFNTTFKNTNTTFWWHMNVCSFFVPDSICYAVVQRYSLVFLSCKSVFKYAKLKQRFGNFHAFTREWARWSLLLDGPASSSYQPVLPWAAPLPQPCLIPSSLWSGL